MFLISHCYENNSLCFPKRTPPHRSCWHDGWNHCQRYWIPRLCSYMTVISDKLPKSGLKTETDYCNFGRAFSVKGWTGSAENTDTHAHTRTRAHTHTVVVGGLLAPCRLDRRESLLALRVSGLCQETWRLQKQPAVSAVRPLQRPDSFWEIQSWWRSAMETLVNPSKLISSILE